MITAVKPRPIEWKKTKWQRDYITSPGCGVPLPVAGTESREWKATVDIPASMYLPLALNCYDCVNIDKYQAVEPKRLRFVGISGVWTQHDRVAATLHLSERQYDQFVICAHDPEGGLFGLPVIHEIEVYKSISFTDVFQKLEDACP